MIGGKETGELEGALQALYFFPCFRALGIELRSRILLIFFAAVVVLLAAGAFCAWLAFDPMRRPSEQIHASILERTPLGTTHNDVRAFLDVQGWKHHAGDKEGGDFWQYRKEHEIKGESAICARLGSYQGFPWYVTVDAVWVFDADGKLIGVQVFKTADSP